MPTQRNADPRAWTADSIDEPASWNYPLPESCLGVLEQVSRDLRKSRQPVTETRLPESDCADGVRALRPVRTALETGRGFAVIEGLPGEPLSPADAQVLYWIVGQGLGRPAEQNVQGTLLYDVRDTGQEVTQGARFSVTKYESSFHTDNSFGTEVVDYVGLLCLQNAMAGGRSQVLSGYSLYEELLAQHPDVVTTLSQPFHIDRRGGVREGEAPTVEFPILERAGPDLFVRYLRYWIEAGHDKAGKPLGPARRKALDVLDEFLRRRHLRVEFDLKPGQMFFLNNRWILHNRTAFEDHAEPERRRHLVRLWLRGW
jgi:alpha-ketoglutarate-dependent taurine dioxygenase